MLHLLYGEDTYRSRVRLREIVAESQKKGASLHWLYAGIDPIEGIDILLAGISLFSPRMVVVVEEGVGMHTADEEMLFRGAKRSKDARERTLILWEREITKTESSLWKRLSALADKKEEFAPLRENAFRQWLGGEAARRGVRMGARELEYILAASGNSSWIAVNELEKIAIGGTTKAEREGEETVFLLGDAYFSSPRAARLRLATYLASGADPLKGFFYLASFARTVVMVAAWRKRREPVPKEMSIHPFVAKKASAIADRYTFFDLEKFLAACLEEDHRLKTGFADAPDALVRLAGVLPEISRQK